MLNPAIQLYQGKKDNAGTEIDLKRVIKTITGPSLKPFDLKALYSKIQKETDIPRLKTLQAQYDAAKGKLPAVTWAGSFTKRLADEIKNFSGLMVLDIDNISNVPEVLEKFKKWQHTFICFTSPSGAGIKVVVQIQPQKKMTEAGEIITEGTPNEIYYDLKEQYKNIFIRLQQLIKEEFDIEIDKSGKDLCRLCFLCYDPNLYYNEKAKPYSVIDMNNDPVEPKPVKLNKKQQTELQGTGEDLYSVIHFTDKIAQYTEGNRNNYIHLFACNANRKGFSAVETIGFATGHFSDVNAAEVKASVQSAFNHNSFEHGKFKKGNVLGNSKNSKAANAGKSLQPVPVNGSTGQGTNDDTAFTIFWKEHKIEKGKDPNKYTLVQFQLKRVEFTDFLFEQGFHLIETDGTGYQICYSKEGIIKPVDPRHIKKHVFAWCKKNGLKPIEEMLRTGQKQFFASHEMDSLHTVEVDIKTDTETETYFYFKNCWVTVTQDDIITRPYGELQQFIWAGNKKIHEFKKEDPKLLDADTHVSFKGMNCEFAKFCYLVAYNPNSPEEKDFDKETIDQRFYSICSAIGFMLDGYKHPAKRKGIFAVDHKIGDRDEQNGRSGKSIIPKALEYLKVVASISGKNFDPKYQFRYEPITMDAQVINFNDMPRTFDVESIFELIADDYSVNRRNNGFLHFKYPTSPKVWVSTNFTPKGAGDSYSARMHIVEFSDYFNARHSPYDEFGHGMFSSAWTNDEWNRFYNFMLWCVALYKGTGLVEYPKSNFDARKIANEVNIEFIDFMDSDKFKRDIRVKKIEILDEFNKEYQNLYGNKLKPHTFHKWLKQYCKHHSLFFNPHKQGGYDKSNGVEYYSIATTPDFKPVETVNINLFEPQAV